MIRAGLLMTCLAAAALAASAALAGVPVDLRSDPSAAGSAVTLGDLFDGAGRASRVAVAGAPAGASSVVLDAGQIQRLAHVNGLDWSNPNGFRRIVVQLGGEPAAASAEAPAAGRADRVTEILTYARSLTSGEVVQPQDVVWSKVQSHLVPSDAPADAAGAIGQAARRPLRQGSAVSAHDLSPPMVMRKGEIVTVVYLADGVELTAQGRAGADAALGQVVEIVNIDSKKSITAVAAGPSRAVTGPGADAFRSRSLVALR